MKVQRLISGRLADAPRWFWPVLLVETRGLKSALGKRMLDRQQEALPRLSQGEGEPGH